MHIKPLVVGITGGVGSGKSSVLKLLAKKTESRIVIADDEAKKMQEPGQTCYNEIVALFKEDVLNEDKTLDRQKLAKAIYEDPSMREKMNAIVHPVVNAFIKEAIDTEKKAGRLDYLFIEAALLIECGYESILDELWYVYAPKDVRKKRLMSDRGYSEEKCEAMFKSQLSDDIFRQKCVETIDNSGSDKELEAEVDRVLGKKRREFFGEG